MIRGNTPHVLQSQPEDRLMGARSQKQNFADLLDSFLSRSNDLAIRFLRQDPTTNFEEKTRSSLLAQLSKS
jgi:hypothetical protein